MSDMGGMGETSSFNQSSLTNQTEVHNSSQCGQVDTLPNTFFLLGYSLVFLVGVVLNSFTMKFYLCQAQQGMSSKMMVYLKNLAAADFLICLCLPLYIANYTSTSITIHRIYCNFGLAAFYLNMFASILFMSYIAANRYLKIIHPLRSHILLSVRAAHIVSTVTWVFLLVTASTFVILSLVNQNPLSLISLLFFYVSISCRVSLAQQSQLASSDSTSLVKSRRNMLVLVSVFCVCFIPYHLVRLPYVFLWMKCPGKHVLYYLLEVSRFISVLNICLDPILYIIMCKAFRRQLNLNILFRAVQVMMQRQNKDKKQQGHLNTISVN